jgi:predicted secreted acid phosphatase
MVGGYRSEIKIFVDSTLAYELLDRDNARNYPKKESLHAIFVVTHYKLKQLFEYAEKNPEERFKIEKETLNALSELGENLNDFSDKCYKSNLKKYDLLKNICN